MDIKGIASKGSEENVEHVIGNFKRTLIIQWQKAQLNLSYTVMWKVEFVRNVLGYLDEEIYKNSVKVHLDFFLAAYLKCGREKIN